MSEITEFHTSLVDTVTRHIIARHQIYLTEFQLPNRKIADIITMDDAGMIEIIEVKTLLSDPIITTTWEKYHPFCNRLTIAAPATTIDDKDHIERPISWKSFNRPIGFLMIANGYCRSYVSPAARTLPTSTMNYMRHLIAERSPHPVLPGIDPGIHI